MNSNSQGQPQVSNGQPQVSGAPQVGSQTPSQVTPTSGVAKLESGSSPLDFIERNLAKAGATFAEQKRSSEAVPQVPVPAATTTPTQVAAPSNPQATSTPYDLNPTLGKEGDKGEQKGETLPAAGDTATGDADFDIETAAPAAENFKKLRTKYKETTKTLSTIQDEKKTLEEKLAKYETGEIVPEILQEKENRIQELSHYEKLHNLKFSPEYQESFIAPIEETESKLVTLAEEYGIPKETINSALNASNKDLNQFLSNHFDDVAAIEAKQLINNLRNLKQGAAEAEKQPLEALASLREEHTKINEVRDVERKNKIADSSRNAWTKALLKIREEGKASELIMRESDPEFNDKIVKPIVTAAAQEYGKLVTILAESGLKHLTEDAAYALARMTQLAHASAVSIQSRDAAIQHADEIERNTSKLVPYTRPSIGGGRSTQAAAPVGSAPKSPAEAGRAITQSILSERQG